MRLFSQSELDCMANQYDLEMYYHIETSDELRVGMAMNRTRLTWHDKTDVTEYMSLLGLDTVTRFGEKFLFGHVGCAEWKWETACREVLCEWIRRERFPTEPSRLHSVFGVASLEEAQTLKASLAIPDASIWRVGCETAVKKDMQWFTHGDTLAERALCVEKYWSGHATAHPIWEYLLCPTVLVYERLE